MITDYTLLNVFIRDLIKQINQMTPLSRLKIVVMFKTNKVIETRFDSFGKVKQTQSFIISDIFEIYITLQMIIYVLQKDPTTYYIDFDETTIEERNIATQKYNRLNLEAIDYLSKSNEIEKKFMQWNNHSLEPLLNSIAQNFQEAKFELGIKEALNKIF